MNSRCGKYKRYRNELPQWTISKFAGIGLETFAQNFTAKLPLSLNQVNGLAVFVMFRVFALLCSIA